MTLPDVCPKDGVSHCKKKACHLYVVEWRTGDEQCVIGYRSTHKQLSKSMPMEDTYAERTRIRLEKPTDRESRSWAEPTVRMPEERKHLERQRPDNVETIVATPERKPIAVMSQEEIVVNNKDTTVIESRHSGEKKDDRKRKSLDELMNLDLPENYEKEFWE
ncbi:hypothetical protein RE476_09790 [Methanolobus mangrovi]|uniref:Uncharacterized protein n=1 Tax=Methanolobus mangrovi TaxID=3072977 RepID=A0AA51UH91_9EURY|nr:hypothetical protein [Methanolobus mangrovi]WMW21671.1 hypothetical protein RE476_09790 [Methanolobus mangrovi]